MAATFWGLETVEACKLIYFFDGFQLYQSYFIRPKRIALNFSVFIFIISNPNVVFCRNYGKYAERPSRRLLLRVSTEFPGHGGDGHIN